MGAAGPYRATLPARLGLLGAVPASSLVIPDAVRAGVRGDRHDPVIDLLRPVLCDLTRDTFNGLAAFVVPGRDAYSRAQGTPRAGPGAIGAGTPDRLLATFDHLLPLPEEMARAIAGVLASGLPEVPVALPGDLSALSSCVADTLDGAVQRILARPDLLPLSQVVALLLNLLATQVDPATTRGPLRSPFARLSVAGKATVLGMLEEPDPVLLAAVQSQLAEPLRGAVRGLLLYLAGGLRAFPAFGTHGTWSTLDPRTMSVGRRPAGWDVARFAPCAPDGWNDFTGYYRGRPAAAS
jgi:hypothetical protein